MEKGTTYMHATPPAPVGKYRDDDPQMSNIMFDRRIVRGNTYAAQVVTQNAQREVERLRVEKERAARKEAAKKRRDQHRRPGTPEAVEGRTHCEVQTESYLEVLSDKPIEQDVQVQTDAVGVLEEDEPLFIPAKTGADKATEIPAGDLFDFDLEVAPILDVLVGKTLKIAMLEVMEEEELDSIRQRQDEFERMRNAELAEVQRLDAEAARKFAEKQRRVKQEHERLKAQAEFHEKIAARNFAKHFFADVSDAVFDDLHAQGHFQDPVLLEVQDHFVPWLLDSVIAFANSNVVSRQLCDDLIQCALRDLSAPSEAPPSRDLIPAPAPAVSA